MESPAPLDCRRRSTTVARVTRPKTHHRLPTGHVLVPAAAIGGLSLALAAGLEWLGILDRTDIAIARLVSRGGAETFPKSLHEAWIWLAAGLLAFSLAAAILATPGHWRRVILWLTAIIVVAAWAPVLSIASHAPDIAAPWIATLWSGVCAIVYASNHRMAIDASPTLPR